MTKKEAWRKPSYFFSIYVRNHRKILEEKKSGNRRARLCNGLERSNSVGFRKRF